MNTDFATESSTASEAAQYSSSDSLPLSGLRVLDFGHTVMGPACGLVLADLGADVVRIEPVDGDRTRTLGGFGAGFYAAFNRNKRSIGIDLKTAEGLSIVRRLIRDSDIIIENFAPGAMHRLGLDWPVVRQINRRVIYCSLKGYLSGPYEELLALDEVVQMQSGLAFMTGPVGQPLRAGASVVDIIGGIFGAVGIMAGLRDRDRTGKGQLVKSSLFESAAFLVKQHMAVSAASKEPLMPMSAKKASWAIYDIFSTADKPVFVAVTSDAHWQRFRAEFELGEWSSNQKYLSHEGRLEARETLMAALIPEISGLGSNEVIQRCRRARVPCAPVNTPEDLFNDEHLNASDGLVSTKISGSNMAGLPALPLEMGEQRLPLRRQPPEVGEGGRSALYRVGFTDAEIDQYERAGIITAPVESAE